MEKAELAKVGDFEKNESNINGIISLNMTISFRKHRIQSETKEFHCETSNLKQFKCQCCDFETDLKLAVDRHKVLAHSHRHSGCSVPQFQLSCYVCKKCDFETYSLLVFARHICVKDSTILDRTVEVDECEQCPSKSDKISKSKQQMNEFNCESSILQQFKCQFCDFESDLKLIADRHKTLVHRRLVCSDPEVQLRYYCCNKCDFKTYSILVFARHICNEDSTIIVGNVKELAHTSAKSVQWYKCEHCMYKSKTKYDLKSHILRKHTDPENIKWFQCNHCPYKAKVKRDLQRHILNKHTDSKAIQWHECEYCPFKTKLKEGVKRHVLYKHTDSEGTKWYKCDDCTHKTKCKRNLTIHVLRKHRDSENVKWFECEHCAYKGKSKGDVKQHILNKHTDPKNIKWHKCEHCMFKTKTNYKLRQHVLRIHLDFESVKWFKCKLCVYKSKWKNEFERHVWYKHADPVNVKVLISPLKQKIDNV